MKSPQMVVAEAAVAANDCDLKVAWFNCAGGLNAKIDNIKLILSLHDFDILFISEAEIRQTTNTSLFHIDNYDFFASGAFSLKGHSRSAVFIRSSLKYKLRVYSSEIISVEINDTLIIGVYRQFKLWPGETNEGELLKILEIVKTFPKADRKSVV